MIAESDCHAFAFTIAIVTVFPPFWENSDDGYCECESMAVALCNHRSLRSGSRVCTSRMDRRKADEHYFSAETDPKRAKQPPRRACRGYSKHNSWNVFTSRRFNNS